MPVRRPMRPTGTTTTDDADTREDGADEAPVASSMRRPMRRPAPSSANANGPRRALPKPRSDDGDAPDERGEEENEETAAAKAEISSGWDSFRSNRAKSSKIPDQFKVEKNASYIIKFLDNQPFASFRQHWIERQGKKSFICREQDCPLCDILGDEPRPMAVFNVLEFTEVKHNGEMYIEPVNKVWEVGSGVGSQLEKLDSDEVTGPLDSRYWHVSKSGTGGQTKHAILPIKERDLLDDYGFDPLTPEELAKANEQRFTKDYVRTSTRGELREIAAEVA